MFLLICKTIITAQVSTARDRPLYTYKQTHTCTNIYLSRTGKLKCVTIPLYSFRQRASSQLSTTQDASWIKWGKDKNQNSGEIIIYCYKQTKDNTFFVNVPLKLLSPEAFFSPKSTKYRLVATGGLTALPQTS